MQLGILGFPKVGKTTLFNILTASHQATDKFAASRQTNVGVAHVPDARLVGLRDLFRPKKFTPATVEYVDIPGIRKGEGAEPILVTPELVGELLGKPRFRPRRKNQEAEVGVATGLAWTEVGGELLETEVGLMKGKGKLQQQMQQKSQKAIIEKTISDLRAKAKIE